MKKILFLLLALSLSCSSFAQGRIKKKRTLHDKVFFGGGLGLQFGAYTGIEISPFAGYKPINNMYTGLKLTYQHINTVDNTIVQNVYGGSVFAEYVIFDRFIGHAEFEALSIYVDSATPNYSDQFWNTAPLIGGGLFQKVGDRSALIIMALFDVSGSSKSIYNNPIIRILFLF